MYTLDTKLTITVAKVRDTYTAIYRVGALDTDIRKTITEPMFRNLRAQGAELAQWSDPVKD